MRIPGPIKAGPVIMVWLLAGLFLPHVVRAQTTCAEQVFEIENYCKKIDRFIKANQKSSRVFVSTSPNAENPENWREYNTQAKHPGDDPNTTASVWLSHGKIVGVSFSSQNESRDQAQNAMYYYREDGTLARISSQLNVLKGEITFIREQFYDRKGLLIRGSTKSCSLKTGRESKIEKRFSPEPLAVYLTTDRLPFYQALGKELRISNFECVALIIARAFMMRNSQFAIRNSPGGSLCSR